MSIACCQGALDARVCGDDCDDLTPGVHPGATEVCNGRDEDCTGVADEGTGILAYRDADGDGFGAASPTMESCAPPLGWSLTGGDCDDSRAARNPASPEVCDALDNDCDASVDEGAGFTFYRDADGDAFGTMADTRVACQRPDGFASRAGDCDDASSARHPALPEICDGIDNDCNGLPDDGATAVSWYPDDDGDGAGSPLSSVTSCVPVADHVLSSGDCDDTNPARNPAAPETCDATDNDCDARVDEGALRTLYRDADGDSYGTAAVAAPGATSQACAVSAGWSENYLDCDDTRPSRNPGAPEVCDGVDNDCNGLLDYPGEDPDSDGHTTPACGGADCDNTRADVYPGALELCDGRDNDCDGRFDGPGEDQDLDARASVACGGNDCDDARADVYPAAPELCDGRDNDCDGLFDGPSEDVDGDRYVALACGGTDCDDTRLAVHPGAVELCDARDTDCDGALLPLEDDDEDGSASAACGGDDCDDAHASARPGAPELCDGLDNNCNGLLDAPGEDDDRDAFADLACGVACIGACGDCNDARSDVYPAGPELCDGRDNDCDGVLDGPGEDDDLDQHADVACGACAGCDDCDDTRAGVHPGARPGLWPDGLDQDCDGISDEVDPLGAPLASFRDLYGVGQIQSAVSSVGVGTEQVLVFVDANRGSLDLAMTRVRRDDATISLPRTYLTTDVDHTERDPVALGVGGSIGVLYRTDTGASWSLSYLRASPDGVVELAPVSVGVVDAPVNNGSTHSEAYHRPRAAWGAASGTILAVSVIGGEWHRTMIRASDGAVVAPASPIGLARAYGSGVAVGYDAPSDTFLVAGMGVSDGLMNVRAIGAGGALLGPGWTAVGPAAGGPYGENQPAVVSDEGSFLIAYASTATRVAIARIHPSAAILTAPVSFPVAQGIPLFSMDMVVGPAHVAVGWTGGLTLRRRSDFASVSGVYPEFFSGYHGAGLVYDQGVFMLGGNGNTGHLVAGRAGVY